MARHVTPAPTEGELAILNTLWQRGPSTVRQVHESLRGDDNTRYTTTLKQLQVMAEKRLVKRDDSQKSHVYSAAIGERGTKRTLVAGVIDRVFDGSVRKMVLHALEARDIDDEEVAEIKRLLDKREKCK
jgi:predicted transcriptional regulator